MASFFDLSTWSEKKFLNTGGTRNKCIVENPETGELYYFKTSLKKDVIDYKYEFWSEIIASEYGSLFGFNMLRYDIAFKDSEVGCISRSMNVKDNESLTEGVRFLTGYDNTYQPSDKQTHDRYTFDFICKALEEYKFGEYINEIIRIIIFDSLIGNGDRHQENWGIITTTMELSISPKKERNLFELLKKFLVEKTRGKQYNEFESPQLKIRLILKGEFAPIYDSGSCLGREIGDEKMSRMLKDWKMFDAYINRGVSEIRWDGPKLNHFELVKKLKERYADIVTSEINRVIHHFDNSKVREIVFNVDQELPEELLQYKLPNERKEFILKMITSRFEKLKEILK